MNGNGINFCYNLKEGGGGDGAETGVRKLESGLSPGER